MYKELVIADLRSNNNAGKCTGHFVPVAKMYQNLFHDRLHVRVAGGPIYTNSFEMQELLLLPNSVVAGIDAPVVRLFKILENCWVLYRNTTKDSIVVMQQGSDVITHIVLFLFWFSRCKLLLIRYSDEAVNSIIKKTIFYIVKKRINGILCPNSKVGEAFSCSYCVIPDYIFTGPKCTNSSIEFSQKKYDFCVVGRLNHDKGVIETARKFQNKKETLLIAGNPIDAHFSRELSTICKGSDNIDLRLGYLSDQEYSNSIKQSRYCILNYQGEYSKRSSGVVYDTIFAGIPVVGCKCEALQFVEENGVGYIYDNIHTFNPDFVINNTLYKSYLENICKYRQSHSIYWEKIVNYVLTDSSKSSV